MLEQFVDFTIIFVFIGFSFGIGFGAAMKMWQVFQNNIEINYPKKIVLALSEKEKT